LGQLVPLKLILEFMPSGQQPNDVCEQFPGLDDAVCSFVSGSIINKLFNKTKMNNMTAKIIINDLSIYIF
jgi:hypothetical protein